MQFTKQNIPMLRREIEGALYAVAQKHGIKLDLGTIRFSSDNFRTTLTAKTSTVTPQGVTVNTKLAEMIARYDLLAEKNGARLIDYDERKHKYPFIYEKDGKRWKGPLWQIQTLFGKEKVPA